MTDSRRAGLLLLIAYSVLCGGQLLLTPAAAWLGAGGFVAALGMHLLGGTLAVAHLSHTSATPRPARVRRLSLTLLWLAALVALAAVLRLVWLERIPQRVDGDAAAFALGGADFLGPDPPPLVGTGWQSHTNLLFWLYALPQRLMGRTVLSIRLLGALGGIAGVAAIFALGTQWWNRQVGAFAALAAAVLPFGLVFARVGTEVIHLTWLLPLAALCATRGWERRSWRWLLLGGAVTGLSQYFYPGARLLPLLVLGQLALRAWFERDADQPAAWQDLPVFERPAPELSAWRRLGVGLLWVALGFGLVYAPMIAYFVRHPAEYSARVALVSITHGDWLQQQLALRPWWALMGDQLRRAFLPFVYPVGGARLWYLWPQYLGVADAALLLLGGAGIFAAGGAPRWLRWYLALYFGLGMLLAGAFTIDSPMPSRYVIFVPGVALLIGYGLYRLTAAVLALTATSRADWGGIGSGIVAALLLAYAAADVRAYLRHDTVTTWTVDPTGQMASAAADYLQSLPDQRFDILFLTTPLMYYSASPTLPFLADKPATNLPGALSCASLMAQLRSQQTIILAPPPRIVELEALSAVVPVAELHVLRNPLGAETAAALRIPHPTAGTNLCAMPSAALP